MTCVWICRWGIIWYPPPRLDGGARRVLAARRLPRLPRPEVDGQQLGERGPWSPAADPLPETRCSEASGRRGGALPTALSQRPPPGTIAASSQTFSLTGRRPFKEKKNFTESPLHWWIRQDTADLFFMSKIEVKNCTKGWMSRLELFLMFSYWIQSKFHHEFVWITMENRGWQNTWFQLLNDNHIWILKFKMYCHYLINISSNKMNNQNNKYIHTAKVSWTRCRHV